MKQLLLLLLTLPIACRLHAQQTVGQKMSALVREAAAQVRATAHRAPGNREPFITAFVRTTDDTVLDSLGCRTYAQLDDISIAAIPLQRLTALASHPAVLRIEAGQRAQALMDTVPKICNILPVYQATQQHQAYTGKDVVVGLMDIGFDMTHPTFFSNRDGNCRIKAMWDMLSKDTIGSSLPVGRDFVGTEAVLAHGHSVDGLTETHGTHTLGIAAGMGYNTLFRGVAYDSDICLVSNAVTSDTIYIDADDYYKYTTATDALGFKYLFDYAEQQNKPCVVSFSEGYTAYLDEDDRLYAEFLEKLTGPGRIIVVAAGNENTERTYADKPVNVAAAGAFIRSFRTAALYRLKSDGSMLFRLHAYANGSTPSHTLVVSSADERLDSLLTDTLFIGTDTCAVTVSRYPSAFNQSESILLLQLNTNRSMDFLPPMAIVAEGADSHVEIYGSSTSALTTNNIDPRWNAATYGKNILAPAFFPAVICVGNVSHRMQFTNIKGVVRNLSPNYPKDRRALSSSTGPAMNGLMKPDISAPGQNIISSVSSFYMDYEPSEWWADNVVRYSWFNGRRYYWGAESGTSMACPAVAGIIALWLQAKPTLTRQDIIGIISRTSRHPDAALTYPNNEYGYGEIDAYHGLLDITGASNIQGLSTEQPAGVHIRYEKGRLLLSFTKESAASIQVTLYALSGKQLYHTELTPSSQETSLSLPALPAGVYAVQLSSSDQAFTGSQLIKT